MESNETQVSESTVRKIQNLLKLAERPEGNEAEAAAAMAMAQSLLAKYNLELHTVAAARVAGGTNEPEEKREKSTISRSAVYLWQQELWGTIAEANYCFYWARRVKTTENSYKDKRAIWVKRHVILGREANVVAVRMMGEYLADTIERVIPYKGKERLSNAAVSWRMGCAARLQDRIRRRAWELRTKDEASGAGAGSALAIRNMADAEYEANYDALYGKGEYRAAIVRQKKREEENAAREAAMTPAQKEERDKEARKNRRRSSGRSSTSNVDWAAYSAGEAKGREIGLDSQVSTTATPRLG